VLSTALVALHGILGLGGLLQQLHDLLVSRDAAGIFSILGLRTMIGADPRAEA
jgi:hypothetical protein